MGLVIGLVGISGVGKSYLKQQAIKNIYELAPLFAATTRPKRSSEIDGVDKYFISENIFFDKNSKDEMFLVQEIYGHMYGFMKKDILQNINYITEMLFTDIEEMQKFTDVKLVYLYSNNSEVIYNNLRARYDNSELFQERLVNDTIIKKEHEKMLIKGYFNFEFENNFDDISTNNFISLIKLILFNQSTS